MKAALAVVGALLTVDAGITLLLIAIWVLRGHVPDFLTATVFGVWSVMMVFGKTVGGAIGAVQLWRLKPSGRLIAGMVLANNIVFTIAAAIRAGVWDGRVWATVAFYAVALAIVATPAARAACQPTMRFGRVRPRITGTLKRTR
jgi:hypothetical protein